MRRLKDWYTYSRRGIIYVQFKDRETGKKLTAKSTHTRDKDEAARIINELFYNPKSGFNQSQWEKHKALFSPMIQASVQESIEKAIKALPIHLAGAQSQQSAAGLPAVQSSYPAEIRPLAEKLRALTFYDFLLLYWDYQKSPYIKQKIRLGKKIPNPERFNATYAELQHYQSFFTDTKLTDITADEVNTTLGLVKNTGLKDSTVSGMRYACTQPLRFAYENNLIPHDITKGITRFSKKSAKKEVFTKEELKLLFDSQKNHFHHTDFLLINKLLFKTGCRIGEILALQIKDIIRTPQGYVLDISKSYSTNGKRLKETKTGRADMVHISEDMAAELLEFIKTNPFQASTDAFIFYSKNKNNPKWYTLVYKNFSRVMKELGINRKGLSIHSYRHTYAVQLAEAGYSQSDLLYLTRHDSVNELQRYMSHITPEMERKNKEAAYLFEKIIA